MLPFIVFTAIGAFVTLYILKTPSNKMNIESVIISIIKCLLYLLLICLIYKRL